MHEPPDGPPEESGDEPTRGGERRRRRSQNPVDFGEEGTPTREHLPASLRTTQPLPFPAAAPAPRRPCVLVLAGPRVGELIPIEGHLVIGRDAGTGLQILDEGVSRRHCRVSVE